MFILDVFENKSKGIFQLLDDTCKIQCQNSTNFVENIISSWTNNKIISTPKPKEIHQDLGFKIQHFAGDVCYNAVSRKIKLTN